MKFSIDGALAKKILALAGPTVGAMISQTLINEADTIMIGFIPGTVHVGGIDVSEAEAGQAVLGPSMALMWMVGGALSAISVGTQALTARRIGEKDPLGAGRVLANSVLISLVGGTIASLLFWFLTPKLLPIAVNVPAQILVGVPFLRWRYLAVLSMAVTASYKSFFDANGNTKVHFVVAVAMNVVNFVLNLGLIFGMFGMPKMGVGGSGVASCISSYVGCFMIVGWSFRKSFLAKFQPYRFANFVPTIRREIMRLSAPSSLAVVISLLGFSVFYKVCSQIDLVTHPGQSIYGAATADIISIFMLVFISCMAYGSATATLVGQGLGAGDHDLAERSAIEAAKIGALVFTLLGAFTVAFPTLIMRGWAHDNQAVIEAGAPILRVLGFFEPFACVALVFTYALYGAGDSRFVMIVELTLHGLCLVPLSYLLGLTFGFGIWGVWGAMMAYVVLMTIIMTWKFNRGSWKAIRI